MPSATAAFLVKLFMVTSLNLVKLAKSSKGRFL